MIKQLCGQLVVTIYDYARDIWYLLLHSICQIFPLFYSLEMYVIVSGFGFRYICEAQGPLLITRGNGSSRRPCGKCQYFYFAYSKPPFFTKHMTGFLLYLFKTWRISYSIQYSAMYYQLLKLLLFLVFRNYKVQFRQRVKIYLLSGNKLMTPCISLFICQMRFKVSMLLF